MCETRGSFHEKNIPEHIRKSPCAQVYINYTLGNPAPVTTDSGIRSCNTCLMPFRIIDQMKKIVDNRHVGMLDDCILKIKLFIAHSIRSQNQNRRCEDVKNDLSNHQALIIMDFKMKCEPMFYREKSTQFYGKQGISWHGTLVLMKHIVEADANISTANEFDLFYFDHILMCDTTQDAGAVLSIFEALIWRMKQHHPRITEIFVQSDNASAYQCGTLLYSFEAVALALEIRILGFLYQDTQGGKDLVDAHFSIAMKDIGWWLNEGYDVGNEQQLVEALRSNGGIGNTTIELLYLNRTKIDQFYSNEVDILVRFKNVGRYSEAKYIDNHIYVYDYSNLPATQILSKLLTKDKAEDENDANENELNDLKYGAVVNDGTNHDDELDTDEAYSEMLGETIGVVHEDFGNPAFRGSITGCEIFELDNMYRFRSQRRCVDRNQEEEESSDFDMEDLFQCEICKRQFRSQHSFLDHTCKKYEASDDITTFALKEVVRCVDNGALGIINTTKELVNDAHGSFHDLMAKMEALNDSGEIDCVTTLVSFHRGWGRRPPHGYAYGKKYVNNYSNDIEIVVNAGFHDKSKRMGPSKIRQFLISRYPGNIDVPFEGEIQGFIARLLGKWKKTGCKTDFVRLIDADPQQEISVIHKNFLISLF